MNEKLTEELKKHGLKTTKARVAVLQALSESSQPVPAEQLYLLLRNQNLDVNLSTVYRCLESLEQVGMITRISILSGESMLFEYNNDRHRHYLICLGCKKIVTVHHCPLGNYERELEESTDYQIEEHRLYLYGYCGECKKEK